MLANPGCPCLRGHYSNLTPPAQGGTSRLVDIRIDRLLLPLYAAYRRECRARRHERERKVWRAFMASATSMQRQHLTRRVFISSTALHLGPHRERVRDTLLSLGLFPVGMEQFGAQGTGDATSVSTEKVASADAYLGIIAWRYGYVPAGAQRSVTHAEYEEAGRLGLPRYIFLAAPTTDAPDGPDALFPASVRDPEHRGQLDAFRAEVGRSHVVDFFTTPADLAARVATALHSYLIRVREDELTRGLRPP